MLNADYSYVKPINSIVNTDYHFTENHNIEIISQNNLLENTFYRVKVGLRFNINLKNKKLI